MKKLLLVLAIGTLAAFVACNDGGGAEASKADSSAVTPAPADSTVAPAPADSAAAPAPAVDSTKKDSTVKKKK